ncbi:hypothetical protein IWQ62_002002 [Dispira parvispora]|uniref:Maf-like protein n=1 Tax=Dispira parvispora TaxID=1520584 RepID=A0A9W8AUT6_9FUNG|nr:hypothetical protein IWQ62_002002 [Dispira parvispora]
MAKCLSLPFLNKLRERYDLVLASGSPRRQDLLSKLGIPFKVVVSTYEEKHDQRHLVKPVNYVVENAKQKALHTFAQLNSKTNTKPIVVIGADTVVVAEGEIFEKPRDEKAALEMLKTLRDKPNTVMTGLCVIIQTTSQQPLIPPKDFQEGMPKHLKPGVPGVWVEKLPGESGYLVCGLEETTVHFDPDVSNEVLAAYVDTEEPMDKAGSYGYQDLAAFFVSHIEGDFYNVVGFPCHLFFMMLFKLLKE